MYRQFTTLLQSSSDVALRISITLTLLTIGGLPCRALQGPVPLGLDTYRAIPATNSLTRSKVALGRTLFFDPLLSSDGSRSCASCHRPEFAFADGSATSVGVLGRVGTRNVPTLLNRTYGRFFFWDGRTTTLEEQVLRPIQEPTEMSLGLDEALKRLKDSRQYSEAFARVFAGPPTRERLAFVLSSYVRTILAGNAPMDRYLAGDSAALSGPELEGFRLFRGKGNCSDCHIGPLLSDETFHNTGVAWQGDEFRDEGRFLVTGRAEDRGAFKTPTLREIRSTAPYMHDGSLKTLREVIDFYDQGGRPNENLDPVIRPLHLTENEKRSLESFLESLTGTILEGALDRDVSKADGIGTELYRPGRTRGSSTHLSPAPGYSQATPLPESP